MHNVTLTFSLVDDLGEPQRRCLKLDGRELCFQAIQTDEIIPISRCQSDYNIGIKESREHLIAQVVRGMITPLLESKDTHNGYTKKERSSDRNS